MNKANTSGNPGNLMLVKAAKLYRSRGRNGQALRLFKNAYRKNGNPRLGFEIAKTCMASGDLISAKGYLEECIKYREVPADWWYRYAVVLERLKEYPEAISAIDQAIDKDPSISEYRYRRGVCLLYSGKNAASLAEFEYSLNLNEADLRPVRRIPAALSNSVPLWRREAILLRTFKLAPQVIEISKHLARVSYWMGHMEQVVQAYERVREQERLDEKDLYKYFRALKARNYDAKNVEQELLTVTSNRHAEALGVGALYEENGDLELAIRAYKTDADKEAPSAIRSYRLGLLYEKSYNWESASLWFEDAASMRPLNDYWQYKAGLNHERSGYYESAINRYTIATDLRPQKAKYWFYRIGICYLELNEKSLALRYLLLSYGGTCTYLQPILESVELEDWNDNNLNTDYGRISIEPTALLNAGRRKSALGDSAGAAAEILKYLEIDEPRDHSNIDFIATTLCSNGLLDVALSHLRDGRGFTMPDGIDVESMTKRKSDRRSALYAEYYDRLPVRGSVILYESYWGSNVSCNPLAVFKFLNDNDGRNDQLKHVWVYQKAELIPEDLLGRPNVTFVKYGSDRYLKYLATAKYLINNATFVPFFVRKPAQIYVNTWHGTPLKTLGRATKYPTIEDANTTRNLHQASLIASPNSYTSSVLSHEFDLGSEGSRKLMTVGSPRLDQVIESDDSDVARVRMLLGLSSSDNRRIVLYAPTWRGTNTSRHVDAEGLQRDLDVLESIADDLVVLFRGHHLTEEQLKGSSLADRIVPRSVDTYDVLQATDILISDYSSLLFDFMVTGRPAVAYVEDEDEYLEHRGLYHRPSVVFRHVVSTREELKTAVSSLLESGSGLEIVQTDPLGVLEMEDGRASRRVASLLLTRPTPWIGDGGFNHDGPMVVGFFASLLPNGITSALRDLLNAISTAKYEVVLFVDALATEPDHIDEFLNQLERPVRVLVRHVDPVFTLEERLALKRFKRARAFLSARHRLILRRAFTRELRRLVGQSRIDVFVQFEGYASYWTGLFACAGEIGGKSIVYLHNEMEHEVEVKYPYLREIFSWMADYDAVASVSKPVAQCNRDFLAAEGYVEPDSLPLWFRNVIDADRVRELASEDDSALSKTPGPKLVAVGRLSVEKNHTLMIDALPMLREKYPSVELTVLGDGPLRSSLESRAVSNGVAANVRFLGQVSNPYPHVAAADLLVLPSLHEGQPVVLFEAVALGTPFVAAPTPGTLDAANILGGRVAEANVSDFAAAIEESLDADAAVGDRLDEINNGALTIFDSLIERVTAVEATRENEDCGRPHQPLD